MTRFELWRRGLWLTVRRSRTDVGARQRLGRIAFFLVYLTGYGWLLHQQYRESGVWGLGFSGVIGGLGVGLALLIGRNNARAGDTLLKLSAVAEPVSGGTSGHRARIVEELLRTAVMVDRAGGEALVRQGKIPAEQRGLFRRRTLDLARRPELWERFSSHEQGLLISDEGGWDWEEVWPRILQAEDVRVMRWVIGTDQVLVPFEFLTPDLTPVLEITVKPGLLEGAGCLESYDLRPAQTVAQRMVSRCIAEGVKRGFFNEADADLRSQYLAMAERMAADESGDLLIGTEAVAQAETAKIQWIGQAALRRAIVLEGLIAYLNGPAEGELKIGGVGGRAVAGEGEVAG